MNIDQKRLKGLKRFSGVWENSALEGLFQTAPYKSKTYLISTINPDNYIPLYNLTIAISYMSGPYNNTEKKFLPTLFKEEGNGEAVADENRFEDIQVAQEPLGILIMNSIEDNKQHNDIFIRDIYIKDIKVPGFKTGISPFTIYFKFMFRSEDIFLSDPEDYIKSHREKFSDEYDLILRLKSIINDE